MICELVKVQCNIIVRLLTDICEYLLMNTSTGMTSRFGWNITHTHTHTHKHARTHARARARACVYVHYCSCSSFVIFDLLNDVRAGAKPSYFLALRVKIDGYLPCSHSSTIVFCRAACIRRREGEMVVELRRGTKQNDRYGQAPRQLNEFLCPGGGGGGEGIHVYKSKTKQNKIEATLNTVGSLPFFQKGSITVLSRMF